MFRGRARAAKNAQRAIQERILSCEDANAVLAVAGESARDFSAINAVTALYRIARALTSRAGRVRRKEAAFVIADARFAEARPVVAPTPSPPPRARRG